MKKLIVGISGASGSIYGVRLLEVLRDLPDIETHMVITNAGKRALLVETDYSVEDVQSLADYHYNVNDIAACIASGSYPTLGMVVAPCSIRSLSGIANCYADNLLLRAADVVLKDRRKLVIVLRETPLHAGHARLILQAIENGAIMMPAMPAFYHRPQTIDELINQLVNRILDQLEIELPQDLFQRWQGTGGN